MQDLIEGFFSRTCGIVQTWMTYLSVQCKRKNPSILTAAKIAELIAHGPLMDYQVMTF